MLQKCLVYRPVAEFPLSDPEFAQAVQRRFPRPNDKPILPTQPKKRHLTILGAREYPDTLPSSRLCVHLPKQSKESLRLNIVGVRMLGECALALVFKNQYLLQEERLRIHKAFFRAGIALPWHTQFKPHITIAKIPGGISRREVISWTENILPTDSTVVVGGITQNSLSGKTFDEAPVIKLIFSNKAGSTPRTTDQTSPPPRRGQRKRRHSRRHSHR